MKKLRFAFLLAVVPLLHCHSYAETRLALLIGNSDYPSEVGRLSLPHDDVSQIKQALVKANFATTTVLDANEDEMNDAFSAFEKQIGLLKQQNETVVAFVYYSGHGASATVNGNSSNYFIPSKESVTTTSELVRKGVSIDEVITGLYLTGADSIFLVADACRNEFVSAFDRSGAKGFVRMSARGGVFIAHSTYPGATAPDDGLYASTLARYIQTPGLEVSRVFQLTNREIAKTRRAHEIPTVANALLEDFCFLKCIEAVKTETAPNAGDSLSSDEEATVGYSFYAPAAGYLSTSFNTQLPDGTYSDWVTIRTSPSAQVKAPATSRVEYARPFRSYGTMIILRTEHGQHVILSGLSRAYVTEGMDVVAGEPIGEMPDRETPTPEINMEYRLGGRPLDPLGFFLNLNAPPQDEEE